jgi:cytochrome P450 family 135
VATLEIGPTEARRTALPRGPRLPAAVQGVLLAQRPFAFMLNAWRRHGDCFTVRLPFHGAMVLLADPSAAATVFAADPRSVVAGAARTVLRPMVGEKSLLVLDGEAHTRSRRALMPAFRADTISRYQDVIADQVQRDMATWPVGRPFALLPHLQRTILEVIMRVVFGVDDPDTLDRLRPSVLKVLNNDPISLGFGYQPDLGPWSPGGRWRRQKKRVDELLYEQIRRRRAEGGGVPHDDMLSLLLESEEVADDEQVRDELMSLLAVGYQSTAAALAWTFERLVRHPTAEARLLDELAGGDDRYLNAVLKESMRARPPIVAAPRLLATGIELMGHRLPPGTTVAPAIFLIHQRADLYPQPDAFRPERFLEGQPEPYAWIPFGGGRRSCLGARFAMFEMAVVVRSVLREMRLRPARVADEGARIRQVAAVPARGAQVVAEPRLA